jgi:hypothetical protein
VPSSKTDARGSFPRSRPHRPPGVHGVAGVGPVADAGDDLKPRPLRVLTDRAVPALHFDELWVVPDGRAITDRFVGGPVLRNVGGAFGWAVDEVQEYVVVVALVAGDDGRFSFLNEAGDQPVVGTNRRDTSMPSPSLPASLDQRPTGL